MAVVLQRADQTHECECPNCKSRIGYSCDEEYFEGDGKGIDCPCCGDFIILKRMKPNKWPDAFWSFGNNKTSVHIEDDTVQEWVDQCIERLRDDKDIQYTYIASGDTFVMADRDENDIVVRVFINYYEAFIEGDN